MVSEREVDIPMRIIFRRSDSRLLLAAVALYFSNHGRSFGERAITPGKLYAKKIRTYLIITLAAAEP